MFNLDLTPAEMHQLRDALQTHIDQMPGGIVRKPYLDLFCKVQNLIDAGYRQADVRRYVAEAEGQTHGKLD